MDSVYIVWNVYGMYAGNTTLLAVYRFAERKQADEHAERAEGYVLRAKSAVQPLPTV